jgi:zinc protease
MKLRILLFLCIAGALAAQTTPSYKDLKYPPLRQVRIPQVATFTLANGMKLYLVENHELPLVSGFALIRTGNLFDPADKIGLADMTGMVLRTGGTKTKTGDDLDVELENVAASVESSIGETSGRISFSALKENTDQVLGIFRDLLTSPEFRQEKIDLAKTQLRSVIARRNDSAQSIAGREFNETVYGKNTPYGWRMEYDTINRIQRQDLQAFYRRYCFPANVMLAVYGDFSTPAMKATLEKLFGEWNVKQPPVPPFPKVEEKPAPGVYLAAKSDVTQTFFALGHLGGELRDKDFPALQVMADILGGGFSSRLFKRVRTQLGYAYNIGSSWAANYDHPGLFQIAGSTKSVSTTETILVAQEEIAKIRSQEVTDDELKTAKDTVLNGFVFNFDTPGKTLSRLVTYEYYGYPKDFIFQYQKAVAAVTKADILRVAREHLRPKDLTIVTVGNPKDFGKPLSALQVPVHDIDLTIPAPKAEAAKSDAVSLEKGHQLLARVQQSVGGADKLAAIKDSTEICQVKMHTPGAAIAAKQTNRWSAPSYFRQDVELPFGKMSTYYNGQGGWMATPQGTVPITEPIAKQAQGEVFRLWFRLLLSDRDAERTVNYLGDSTLEISNKTGDLVRLYVDEKTGLPSKITYDSVAVGGPPKMVEEVYAGWKEVDGIKLPEKITISQAGQKFAEVTVEAWKLNSGLKEDDLRQRP